MGKKVGEREKTPHKGAQETNIVLWMDRVYFRPYYRFHSAGLKQEKTYSQYYVMPVLISLNPELLNNLQIIHR